MASYLVRAKGRHPERSEVSGWYTETYAETQRFFTTLRMTVWKDFAVLLGASPPNPGRSGGSALLLGDVPRIIACSPVDLL